MVNFAKIFARLDVLPEICRKSDVRICLLRVSFLEPLPLRINIQSYGNKANIIAY